MTRKQVALIIFVNALISALISVSVALFVILPTQVALTAAQTALAIPTQAAGATTQVTQLAAQPAAGPAATTTPVIYVVQPGDTLSSLALKHDIPETDIIAANQIQNPDLLPAGMALVIPVGGLPPATATRTPIPTATGTSIPFEPPSTDLTATALAEAGRAIVTPSTSQPTTGELQLEITEILGLEEVEQERVVITNTGDQVADMLGWTLADADGNTYTFPYFRLWAGGSVTVHTRIGQDNDPLSNLFWGKLEAVWSPREAATLKSAHGDVIATHTVRP
jgi:LysM repeat protein